jgi:hypothetical protein
VCATENGTPPTYQTPVKGKWNGTVTQPLSRVPSPYGTHSKPQGRPQHTRAGVVLFGSMDGSQLCPSDRPLAQTVRRLKQRENCGEFREHEGEKAAFWAKCATPP